MIGGPTRETQDGENGFSVITSYITYLESYLFRIDKVFTGDYACVHAAVCRECCLLSDGGGSSFAAPGVRRIVQYNTEEEGYIYAILGI